MRCLYCGGAIKEGKCPYCGHMKPSKIEQ